MSQPSTIFSDRHAHLVQALAQSGLDALALNPGPSLAYLTGLNFHLMERPVTALFTPGKPPIFILPELEMLQLQRLAFEVQAFPFGEDPVSWPSSFQQAAQFAGIESAKVGVEPTRLRVLELRYLKGAAPQARFLYADECMAELRMRKDADEIASMRKAVDIAQRALLATLPMIQPGVSERAIAAELTGHMLRGGCDSEINFAPIVSGGPNSANPHATPTDRPLQTGDLLVIDWGCTYQGYMSDITRTFAIGPVEAEYTHIASIVLQSNAAGRAACRPGVAAQDVDRAARGVIEGAGYGTYFTHRTGHGLGMEVHEPPYIRAGNDVVLEEGMTFTVEPGIYLPGRGGVRIEDDVAITAEGAESLSDLSRELRTL